MAGYIHGLQAAQDRLAKARQTLREAQSAEAEQIRMNRMAEAMEAQAAAIRERTRKRTYVPRAAENQYGGPEGLKAAVKEMAEFNARKKAVAS